MELLSVIVPVYNMEKCLEKCVHSITNQTYRNMEIILVDNGSKDNSGEICDQLARADGRIKVIHKVNGGLSSARNAGLDAASGEYYGFVDSDDYIEPNMYETLMQCLYDYPEVEIACVGIIRESEDLKYRNIIRCSKETTYYNWIEATREILRSRDIGISVWCKVYKKVVFDGVRFPEGKTNEDAHILVELHRNRSVVHSGQPLYHYVIRNGSITSAYNPKTYYFAYENAEKIQELLAEENELKSDVRYYMAVTAYCALVSYCNQNAIKDKNIDKYYASFKKFFWQLIFSKEFSLKIKLTCILLRTNTYTLLKRAVRKGNE